MGGETHPPEGTGSLKEALASGSPRAPNGLSPAAWAGTRMRWMTPMSVPDWVGRSERDALEALANATVLTVMIGQGPEADGHVPPVRYTGFVLGEPDFEAARAFLRDALTFKQRPSGSPPRCWSGTAGEPRAHERRRGGRPPTANQPATASLID